jgi:hypothetical protein
VYFEAPVSAVHGDRKMTETLRKVVSWALFLATVMMPFYAIYDYTTYFRLKGDLENLLNAIPSVAYQLTAWLVFRHYAEEERRLDATLSALNRRDVRLVRETSSRIPSLTFIAVLVLSIVGATFEYLSKDLVVMLVSSDLLILVMVMSLLVNVLLMLRINNKKKFLAESVEGVVDRER